MSDNNTVGIILGTGFGEAPLLTNRICKEISTPYDNGTPALVFIGDVGEKKAALIERHGSDGKTPAHQLNYASNIWALKSLGVEKIISVSAVGSLNISLAPGSLVLLHDFINLSTLTPLTLREEEPYHIDFTFPFCPNLRKTVKTTADELKIPLIDNGVYLCVDGPRYETPSEIKLFAQWGADVVGMTAVKEIIYSVELGMNYCGIALVTNFGCGLTDTPPNHEEVKLMSDKIKPKIVKLLQTVITKL